MAVLLMVSGLSVAVTAQEEESYIEILYGEELVELSLVDYISTFDYMIYPYDNGETVTWTIGDANVLCLDEENNVIVPVAPGETTLTATTNTGLSDTINVVVNEPTAWKGLGSMPLILEAYGRNQLFVYTPSESGEYTMYSMGDGDVYAELYDRNFELIEMADDNTTDYNFVLPMELTAGETYYFHIGAYQPSMVNIVFMKGIETTYTSFDFTIDSVTLNVGDAFIPSVTYEPRYVALDWCDITAADGTIFEQMDYLFVAQKPGTTTLTATAPNGTSATMTVTVQDVTMLTAGDVKTVNLTDGVIMRTYAIVAEETAEYVIQSFDAKNVEVMLNDDAGNYLNGASVQAGGFCVTQQLTAGELYVLCILGYSEEDLSFEIGMVKKDPTNKPTGVSLDFADYAILKQQGDEVWVTADNYITFNVVFEGTYGVMPENYTISVVDENIVWYDLDWNELYACGVGTTTVTVTSASGFNHTYTIHVIADLVGDVSHDGKVDIADAVMLFRYANGRISVPSVEVIAYDLNHDNVANIADAVMLFRYANGRLSSLD